MKIGYPTLLVNGRIDDGFGYGEAFLLLRNPLSPASSLPIKRRIRMQHVATCVKLVSFGKENPPTLEEYMFGETYRWAKGQWEHLKFLAWEKNHEPLLVTQQTEFTEQDSWRNEVARLWFGGLSVDIFQQIMRGTLVKELAEYMHEVQRCARPQDEPI
jgi:hypothetical protein